MIDCHVCIAGKLNISRVCHNQFAPLFLGPHDTPCNQGMTGRGIGADDKNAAGILDFSNGVGHGTTPERGGQPGHRGRVSETGTVIHVIGADHCTGKFLRQIVFFIGDLG